MRRVDAARRGPGRDPRARAPSSTRLRRARSRRGRDRTAARPRPGDRCSAVDTARMREKPKIMPGSTQPSVPPDSSTSYSPSSSSMRGIADRVGRAGAAGREHVADAVQAERDRNLARHHAADADGDGIRRDVPAVVGEEVLVLPLADVDAAAAAADDHAGAGLAEAAGRRRSRLRARRRTPNIAARE